MSGNHQETYYHRKAKQITNKISWKSKGCRDGSAKLSRETRVNINITNKTNKFSKEIRDGRW